MAAYHAAMPLAEQLQRWQAAGLMDAALAKRIAEYERSLGGEEAAPRGPQITPTEVIAYAGAVVVLVGIGFLIGTQYAELGGLGRSLVIGLVGAAGLGAGLFMDVRSDRPAARRARAASFLVASGAAFALTAEVAADQRLLDQPYAGAPPGAPEDTSGNFMLASLAGAGATAVLLLRARAGLLALGLTAGAYLAFGTGMQWTRVGPGRGPEAAVLGIAVLLALFGELMARWRARWAAEVLRFGAVLPPAVVALLMSAHPRDDLALELFAGVIAVTGFAAAILRSSGGFAISAGIALFVFVVEVGSRHFARTFGFPVVLIVSGLALLAIAAGLVRLLPSLGRGAVGPVNGSAAGPGRG